MRAITLPWPSSRILGVLAVGLIAASIGIGIVSATKALEGKWLIAVMAGLSLLWLAVASNRFERFLLALLILSIPFNVDVRLAPPYSLAGVDPLRVSAIDLILCALYPAWITRLLAEHRSFTNFWPPGATPLVALIGWSALSMVNARDLWLSVLLLIGMVKGFLCYLYLANHVKTQKDLRLVAWCFTVGLLLESLIACAQHAAGSTLGLEALGETRELVTIQLGATGISRLTGTLGHPNTLGRYVASVLPLILVLNLPTLPFRWTTRLAIAVASILGTVTLVLTLSRSAWLSAALACFVLVAWLLLQRRKRVGLTPLLLIVIALGIVLVFFEPLITARWGGDDYGTAASRIPQMRVAWSMISSHPVLGVGLNNYGAAYLYDTTPEGMAFRYKHPVHNVYLLLAAEVGLMGLVWLGWFLWTVVRRGWQRITVANDPLTHLVLLGITVGLFALLVDGMMEMKYLVRDTLFLIYSAILAATGPSNREADASLAVSGVLADER